jgi:hypothetical protein
MKDDLSKLLRSWQPKVPEPADFTRNVWRRIELAEPSRRSLFSSWYETVLVNVGTSVQEGRHQPQVTDARLSFRVSRSRVIHFA